MTLPPHNLVQSVLQLYEPDDQGFRLSDVTNLYRSGPGPLVQDTFFQSLSSEQQQTLLDDLMNQVRSYASLNDEQQLQAHNMISGFSDFLIYRREAGNHEVQRPRDANWSKEDVFYYSWAMFCSSRKLQAKMGVAKHHALLRDVADYNEHHQELNKALTEWNRELAKATELLEQAMDILRRRGTQLGEGDLSVVRPPPMARISSGPPPWHEQPRCRYLNCSVK